MAEQRTHKPRVTGSNPVVAIFLFLRTGQPGFRGCLTDDAIRLLPPKRRKGQRPRPSIVYRHQRRAFSVLSCPHRSARQSKNPSRQHSSALPVIRSAKYPVQLRLGLPLPQIAHQPPTPPWHGQCKAHHPSDQSRAETLAPANPSP